MKKKVRKNKLLKYFIYFIIFSFLGSIIESLFGFFGGTGIAYDRGLFEMFNIKIYFISFYGLVGLSLIFLENFFEKRNKHKIKIIYQGLLNALLIVLWELIGGLFSIATSGHAFWDYSKQPFNFLGIISLQMSLIWIVVGYFFSLIYKFIIRRFEFPR
jgi:uncharacterized membrane protein